MEKLQEHKSLEYKIGAIRKTTPIRPEDQGIFARMFATELELERYPNSWSYITQACRGLGELGYKYYDSERLIGIGSHNGHYVIVNPIGTEASQMQVHILNLCRDLYEASSKPVYLKHIQEKYRTGLTSGFKSMEEYHWNKEEPYDDATYPEVITTCNSIIELMKNSKFKARLNAFVNRTKPLIDPHFLAVHYIDDHSHIVHQDGVIRLVEEWSNGNEELAAPYINMIKHPSQSGFSFVMLVQGEVVGFYVFERIGVSAAAGYAMITNYRKMPGATEAGFYLAALELEKFGIEKINLGGSERESLHTYKLKIGETTTRDMRNEHLVYMGQ
jgi:hypothetical protein